MLDLLRSVPKLFVWFVRWSVIGWFFFSLCLMLWSQFRPLPAASEALHAEGISGLPLLVGMGSHAYSDSSGLWKKSRQYNYIVVPDSLVSGDLFSYTITEERGVVPSAEVERKGVVAILLLFYVGAGVHTFLVFRRLWRRRKMRLAHEH